MEPDSIGIIVDKVLLTNVGRDENGAKICGLKDLCDTLKNLLLVASLLFASLTLTFTTNSQHYSEISSKLFWVGLFGIPPLLALLLLLLRQTFLVTSRLPVFTAQVSAKTRAVIVIIVTIGLCGIGAGMLGLVVAAIQKL